MITLEKFGDLQGAAITCATLTSDDLRVQILNYGAITKSIRFAGHELVLGYSDFEGYRTDQNSMGIIAGRCANRIARGQFTLNGHAYQLDCNSGSHHLHGGKTGFGRRIWQMDTDQDTLILHLQSPDGQEGYPANVDATVRVSLSGPTLVYQMTATADAPTLINLAQHSYYDLGGQMRLQIDADHYTPTDDQLIPLGHLAPVTDPLDFRTATPAPTDLDHNFALTGGAKLYGENAALTLTTDQPGLQAYSGGSLSKPFAPNQGLCLEPQFFPNAINTDGFEKPVFGPDKPYSQTTKIAFSAPA